MNTNKVSRRNFLKNTSIAAGGLFVSVAIPASPLVEKGILDKEENDISLNAFIHIADNGDTTIYCGRCEMGQGISTALPAAVADEMEADWQRVKVKQGDADEKYGPQGTGGSASIRIMYQPMREAGAKAKAMLIAAAAKVWQISPENCLARSHFVINQLNQQRLAYGELASIAANMPVPKQVTLKNKSEFNYIGKSLPRHDQSEVVVGKRIYGVDVKIPNLKYAAIIHCPVLGGKLKSLDKTAALKREGVLAVVEIPRFDVPFGSIGGVAVVATNTWVAQQAAKQLKIVWDLGENATYDTQGYKKTINCSC